MKGLYWPLTVSHYRGAGYATTSRLSQLIPPLLAANQQHLEERTNENVANGTPLRHPRARPSKCPWARRGCDPELDATRPHKHRLETFHDIAAFIQSTQSSNGSRLRGLYEFLSHQALLGRQRIFVNLAEDHTPQYNPEARF